MPVLALCALLAGCGAGASAETPTWVPKPSFNGENGPRVDLPGPGSGGSAGGSAPSAPPSGSSAPGSSAPSGSPPTDPNVVATDLAAPLGVAILPDGSALVGERTTGRVLHVQKEPGKPVEVVRTLPGLDAAGDGGLLDLAVSPTYDEDGLVYAYVSTPTDNRVLQFTLHGAVTEALTGVPHGAGGNAGRLLFGADGDLYVGTGDAGDTAAAADPASLAGKLLRITDIGRPADGNPTASSPVFASGLHDVEGLCTDPGNAGAVYVVQGAAPGADAVSVVRAGASGGGTPLATLPADRTGAGGCAVAGRVLFVASRDGQALLAGRLGGSAGAVRVGAFSADLDHTYGRLATVVLAPDGALWLTTTNADGHGTPRPHDEKVLRIQPPTGGGADSPPV